MKIEGVKGTRDFLPKEKFIQDYIFNNWTNIAKKYGYEDFDAPMLEPVELWQLKSGAEIPDQMYTLKDKGDRMLAIRPELTPSLARIMAQNAGAMPKPIRLYCIARCWRYEQPQSGRLREFFQLNVDCLGTKSMHADAEVIATSIRIMQSFGLSEKDVYLRLSNRKITDSIISSLASSKETAKQISRLIDKLDKISKADFKKALKELKLTDEKIEKLESFLEISDLKKLDEKILGEEGKKGVEELSELIKILQSYGLEKYVKVDFTIMRGLDYYTSTVFEVFDVEKEFRAICGGGRYDNLVKDFGGEELAGIGYGMGDVVLELFLKKKGLLPEYKKEAEFFIAIVNESQTGFAIKIAEKLRKSGKNVEVELMQRKIGKQLEYANKSKIAKLIVIGEEEEKNKKFKTKDMKTGKEEEKKLEDI